MKLIYDLYASVNDGSYKIADYFDSYMRTDSLVQNYFTPARFQSFRKVLTDDIRVMNVNTFPTDREGRMGVTYDVIYTLANNKETFTETRTATLRQQFG